MHTNHSLKILKWLAILLVVLSFVTRLIFIRGHVMFWDQFYTTYGEQFCIYSIWKWTHHYAVYEWPQKDWYSLSLYNWLFYNCYGGLCRLFHADAMRIAAVGRCFTTGFATGGSVLTFFLTRKLVKNLGMVPNFPVLAAGSLMLWFSPGTMADTTCTIRPDVPAIFFALCGVLVFLKALRPNSSPLLLVASGMIFYIAWSFKQPVIWTAATCCLCAFLLLGFRRAALLALSWMTPIVITLVLGGEIYRYNILVAPSVSPMNIRNLLFSLPPCLAHGAFVYGWLPCLPFLVEWNRLFKGGKRYGIPDFAQQPVAIQQLFVLSVITVSGTVMGVFMMIKLGSAGNMLFEGLVPLGVLVMISLHRLYDPLEMGQRKMLLGYLCIAFAIPCALQIKNIVLFRQGKLGTTPLISSATYERKKAFGRWLLTLNAPLFIRDHLFAQPWYSNAGNHPAIMVDPVFYDPAKSRGLLEGGGLENLVKKHHFKTLLLTENDELVDCAKQAGYTRVPTPPEQIYYPDTMFPITIGPLLMFEWTDTPIDGVSESAETNRLETENASELPNN